jgi:hypothetical protein
VKTYLSIVIKSAVESGVAILGVYNEEVSGAERRKVAPYPCISCFQPAAKMLILKKFKSPQ